MTRHVRTCALLAAALLGTLTACGSDQSGSGREGSEKARGTAVPAGDEARGFTLVATGDILSHDSIIRQARADAGGSGYDFGKMLEGAKPLASGADLAVCHMETVYGPDGGPFTGYPAFVTPPHVAKGIKAAGYDSCSTASNHTMDAGADGVERTLRAMDKAGLAHAGSARSRTEQAKPTMLRANGAKVAQLAYTYGTNGIKVPEDSPWLVNLIDPKRIIADARAARRAGADVVVVSLHWGDEWREEPNKQQLSLAKQLTGSRTQGRRDVDLILGTHNHVPQAYEKVNGTWVVYGMGDQIAGEMNDPRGQMGSAARFTFAPPRAEGAAWSVKKAEFLPFLMTEPGHRLVSLNSPQNRESGDAGYTEARKTIRDAVLSRGADADGLVMAG